MNSIIVFAIVLAVAGGFIAWLGDRLGTKIGKKRYSFLKLRPRHTATVSTITAGVLISLLTLMVLIVSNNAFKRALLEGPRLVLQNDELKGQIKDQAANFKVYENKVNEKARQADEVQQKFDLKQKQLDLKQQELNKTQTALDTTKLLLQDARQKVNVAQQQVQGAKQKVAATQRQVAGVQRQVRTLQTKRRFLTALTQGLKHDSEFFRNIAANSSFGDLIYHKNEEVGRAVIATGQSPQAIQKELARFLHDLGREAVGRGGPKSGAVVLALPAQTREAQALKALSQNIADVPGKVGSVKIESVVVIARAGVNAFRGEPVRVVLTPFQNARIYDQNAVVATQAVDGSRTDEQIIDSLQVFLTGRVRTAAIRRGLLPLTDPQTGDARVGAIDKTTVLPLVRQIQQAGADAQVTAYADVDTYRGGPVPLQLRFVVTHASSSHTRPAAGESGS